MVTGQQPLNTGTGITTTAGRSGFGGQFNGGSAYLSYPLAVGSGSMTGLTVARFAGTSNQTLLGAFFTGSGVIGNYITLESSVMQAFSTSASNWTGAVGTAPGTASDVSIGARFYEGAGRDVWLSGAQVGSDATARTVTSLDRIAVGTYLNSNTPAVSMAGVLYVALWWTRALSDSEMRQISRNPWQIFRSPSRRQRLLAAAGGSHSTSGALASDAAVLSGAAARLALHTTSGALVSGSASVTGVAAHWRKSTGALAAGSATVAGAAAHLSLHTTSGSLAASAATVAGIAAHWRKASGSLVSGVAVIAGAAAHKVLHATSGGLVGGEAGISGAADHAVPGGAHPTSGAFVAASASVAGAAARLALHTTTATLSAAAAVIAGSADHVPLPITHTTSGALVVGSASIAGAASGPSGGAAGSTGAVLYVPIRLVSGVYAAGIGGTTAPGRETWLPNAMVPFGYGVYNGQRIPVHIDTQSWYQFLQSVSDRLGGYAGPSVPDVVTTVETTQAAAVVAATQVSAIAQQSQTNAEALSAVKEVVQNSALPGADQIPPVSRSPYENIP